MMRAPVKSLTFIVISFIIGMLLAIFPIPNWAQWLRPQWLFLLVLFWVMMNPQRIGVGVAWVVGLLQDLLTGSLLGQHALVFALITYLIIRFYAQFRHFPLWQQTVMVFVLSLFNLVLQYWIMGIVHNAPHSWGYWSSALTSAMGWPFICWFLRRYILTDSRAGRNDYFS